ncbi:MAG: VCBS repeat-containing protein [Vicinamibacterales bacterium]
MDVIVLKAAPPHDVFLNGRVWTYATDAGATNLAAAPIAALVTADADADGVPELYTSSERGLERWRRDAGGAWRAERLPPSIDPDARLATADVDGDGRFELVASSGGGWAAFDTASWATVAASGAGSAAGGWAVAQLDPARGPSIVGIGDDGAAVMWAPGPGRQPSLALTLSGRDPTSDQRRSNVSGLGTRVAVRAGSHWTAFDTTRVESGPGQSLQPLAVGLGGRPRADFVALTWSDGVFQTELDLEAGRLHAIAETQRQLSSCPVLFVWDGARYRFVTDVLGTGGIGFFERPGVYSEPFPRENVLLPADVAPLADGRYRVQIAEPMEEIAYLDRLSLVAYDLPPGWDMVLDERKAINGPAPTGTPLYFRTERAVAHAVDDTGADLTDAVRRADLAAAGPRQVSGRFIGLAERFALTVDFDEAIDGGPGQPVLVIDGWIEYPYAQTVFAAWQAGVVYEAPTLEARGRDGRWHVVAPEFGYPAGMPRRMALPLPELPAGTTALRLTTSQEIYWDRLSVVYAEPLPEVRRHALSLASATLEDVGFARRTTGEQRAPHYDASARAPLGDTRHPRGWYTAFGDVEALVADEDSAVAIVGPGEAVTVDFTAPDAPPEGWTRRVVLEARGWCKDMDLYTRDGETVEPLPGTRTPARARLHPLYNTRYASGY